MSLLDGITKFSIISRQKRIANLIRNENVVKLLRQAYMEGRRQNEFSCCTASNGFGYWLDKLREQYK